MIQKLIAHDRLLTESGNILDTYSLKDRDYLLWNMETRLDIQVQILNKNNKREVGVL